MKLNLIPEQFDLNLNKYVQGFILNLFMVKEFILNIKYIVFSILCRHKFTLKIFCVSCVIFKNKFSISLLRVLIYIEKEKVLTYLYKLQYMICWMMSTVLVRLCVIVQDGSGVWSYVILKYKMQIVYLSVITEKEKF